MSSGEYIKMSYVWKRLAGPDLLGEGPVWDSATNTLMWVDILAGLVHRVDATGRPLETLDVGPPVGFAVPSAAGGVVAGIGLEVVHIKEDGSRSVIANLAGRRAADRINDASCDPRGRLWVGTMSTRRVEGSATLSRVDVMGEVTRVLEGVTISNGLAWSPAGDRLYYIDSFTQRIDVFDVDALSGEVSGRRPFVHIDPATGLPDGCTTDADGHVWVALFGGAAVHRYAPDATLVEVLEVPVRYPTSLAFGGPSATSLYVTSARHKLTPAERAAEPLAGCLLTTEAAVAGSLPPPFAG